MEKIYMEDDYSTKKRKPGFRDFLNSSMSLYLIIFVAVLGVTSLVAFGINQISYAANTGVELPNTFVSAMADSSTRVIGATDSVAGISPVVAYYTKGSNIPVFCIEANDNYLVDKTYTKGAVEEDLGLVYLMAKIYPNVPFKKGGVALPDNVQVWLTQNAIWSYLYEVGAANNSNFATLNDNVKNVNRLYDNEDNTVLAATSGTLFEEFGINQIIADAKAHRNDALVTLNVNAASDNISMTNDKKYYQTDLVSVTGVTTSPVVESFDNFSIDLTGAPAGTIIVGEDGNVINDLSAITPTTKFYVRVPVDKVTNDNKDFGVNVSGNFKMYTGNIYTASGSQKILNIQLLNRKVTRPLSLKVNYSPNVPDTKMTTAQTLYFLGLIVLLSGVGMIYANTKESKNSK